MFQKLMKQLRQNDGRTKSSSMMTSPFESNDVLKKLSYDALNLFERKMDVKKFTRLALSNPENTNYVEQVNELFKSGVKDPLSDEELDLLFSNPKFLKDLGL